MNNLIVKEEEKKEQKSDDVYRLAVTKEAERALIELMEKVNLGFTGGKVNRIEMASWALIRFNKDANESIVQAIRADHFDEVAALEMVLRNVRETGQVSDELRSILQKQVGFEGTPKKTSRIKVDK